MARSGGDLTGFELALAEQQARFLAGRQLPRGTERPPEFAPFGGAVKARILSEGEAKGKLLTNLGHVPWEVDEDDLLNGVPVALRAREGRINRTGRGTLGPGLNFVKLSAEAIASRGLETVLRDVSAHGRIIGHLPESTVILWVEPQRMSHVRKDPNIARTRAWEPYNKIALDFGVRPLISQQEAVRPDIRASVRIVPGLDSEALRERLEKTPGVSELVRLPSNAGYELRIDYRHLAQLAHIPEVLHIAPLREYMTSNAESPATVQMGSAEDGMFMRPFDDAGIDGGGIDTNGDGRRINDGSDAVPPQIVSVIDNGISLDTPNFSQTATQTTTAFDLGTCDTASGVCISGRTGHACSNDYDCDIPDAPIGSRHRKIHGIIAVKDVGTTCDGPLSGSGTHGNVVAAAIAASPSELGFFANRFGFNNPLLLRNARMDGIAKGARILLSDVAGPGRCNINTLVERGGNVDPGNLAVRLNEVIADPQGDQIHLAVLPFGHPDNFSTAQFLLSNGTYNDSAVDLDTFLWNNQDFMIVLPVGNNSAEVRSDRSMNAWGRILPDLFDGTALDNDPSVPRPIQTAAPATAKNILAAGGSMGECHELFAGIDCEGIVTSFTSRGPATPASLRMAPLVTAPSFDFIYPKELLTASCAVFRSRDNDNLPPIEAELDEANFGTSFAAAYVTGLGALVRDYFAQGFYPTASRVDEHRLPGLSGALVKALMAASADFNEGLPSNPVNETSIAYLVRRSRCLDVGSIAGANVGIMCNSAQGYGRAVGTNVLPLANWSNEFELHPDLFQQVREYPAAGLLVYDHLTTGESLIDNVSTTSTHTFLVASPASLDLDDDAPGGTVISRGNLRIALSWPDMPGVAGAGGTLINDLDLVLQGPGPDGSLDTSDDVYYIGNHYGPGRGDTVTDQWSIGTIGAPPVGLTERRNNTEAIHLSGDPDNNAWRIPLGDETPLTAFADSQIHAGLWRVTVKRGQGGAVPGSITTGQTSDPDGDEDDNGNGRLDPGEDDDGDGLLDLPGQPFALVVAGPVFRDPADSSPTGLPPGAHPSSSISFDRARYSCAEGATLRILDTSGNGAAVARNATQIVVLDAAGNMVETEGGFAFVPGAAPMELVSQDILVRLGTVPVANGILEADTGYTIVATYDPGGQPAVSAQAGVHCEPLLVEGRIVEGGGRGFEDLLPQLYSRHPYMLAGGCDHDEHLDAGEVVTYGIAFVNGSTTEEYHDVLAMITPSGPGAAAVRVLEPPRNIGRLPSRAATSAFFQLMIDATVVESLPVADRKVTLTVTLDSTSRGVRIGRQSFSFTHALSSDTEVFYYSTDYPAGGREIRDLNRNLMIDPADAIDPIVNSVLPPEDITFSSMFVETQTEQGLLVSNTLGEDLDNSGSLSGLERDVIPDGKLDRGILESLSGPGPGDLVPFDLDRNGGGWKGFRHPESNAGGPGGVLWEHVTGGDDPVCGFQTAGGGLCDTATGTCLLPANRLGQPCLADHECNNFGIWHAGDGDPGTPAPLAAACDRHGNPGDSATPPQAEFVVDILLSPIIARVNQALDQRGFPYVVEFQRLGLNQNIQIIDSAYAGGGLAIDPDVDDDGSSCLLCQHTDQYYAARSGGFASPVFILDDPGWGGFQADPGINPGSIFPYQRTFGPLVNPDASAAFSGDESGFSGKSSGGAFPSPGQCDQGNGVCVGPADSVGQACSVDADCNSLRILEAQPDFLASPTPGGPLPGICDGGSRERLDCQVDGDCPGGACSLALNSHAGPVRNFEATLLGFEGGFAAGLTGSRYPGSAERAAVENKLFGYFPGPAANRWQIAISFFAIESPGGNTEYGYAWDDLVFEWKESHPRDEEEMGRVPACDRFAAPGGPAGGQCAALTVDRSTLFDCNETVEVTVHDAKCRTAGSGVAAGQACRVDSECGIGGECTADDPFVEVMIVTPSDSVPSVWGQSVVYRPNQKRFRLDAVPGEPGLFRGSVVFSTVTNDGNHVQVDPAAEAFFRVYYEDPLCDGDLDGVAGESDFDNVDGDGVPVGVDNCDQRFNPFQEDVDGDGIGDSCDNCPGLDNPRASDPGFLAPGSCESGTFTCVGGIVSGNSCSSDADCDPIVPDQFFNPGQDDADSDGVGDACEFDDADLDGSANSDDPCPDVWWPPGLFGLSDGDLCTTFGAAGFGVTCDTSAGLCDPASGCSQHTGPCDTSTGVCLWGDPAAPNFDNCATDLDCSSSCTIDADCACDFDRDRDGVLDKDDNCVLTPNGAAETGVGGVGNQTDSDLDGMGDACDPDCTGAVLIGRCLNAGVDAAGQELFCGGFGSPFFYGDCDPGIDGDLPNAVWDLQGICAPYTYHPQDGSSVCSNRDDDRDVDGVEDGIDTCPAQSNPPVIAGTFRQRDSDGDGVGDACDPASTLDDDEDGFPDDIVSFHGESLCRDPSAAKASLSIVSATYRDLDGDGDAFPDSGETGRVMLEISSAGQTLTGVSLFLSSDDPDVICVAEAALVIDRLPVGQTVTVGSLDPAEPGFTFTVSPTMQNPGPPQPPPKIDMTLQVIANEIAESTFALSFSLLADLDVQPGVTQVFTAGPDGIPGDSDDGIFSENFDIDKDGSGVFNVTDTWLHASSAINPGCPTASDCIYSGRCSTDPGVGCDPSAAIIGVGGECDLGACDSATGTCMAPAQNAGLSCTGDADCTGSPVCYSGRYQRGTPVMPGLDEIAAVTCGGYDTPVANPACVLDPDQPMDWHFHCTSSPSIPGVPPNQHLCPNSDVPPCVGGCSYDTPIDENGQKAISPPNSLHLGAHFRNDDSLAGDTTHFRMLAAYQTAPMNLALFPRPDDLELSMKHIARLMDNNGVQGGKEQFQCADCADVQIRLDTNSDPDIDDWGFWDKLVPYQSVYDKKGMAWSAFGTYYCLFTPTDTGPLPPNPRGFMETMCFPQGLWAHCGSTLATNTAATGNCGGTGIADALGRGVWMETRFNLAGFLGQRVEIRFIGASWVFDNVHSSYFEVGGGWDLSLDDDGWWLDDIQMRGTVESQVSPAPDDDPAVPGLCSSATLQSTVPDCDPGTGLCTGGRIGAVCGQHADCDTGACDERIGDGGTAVVLEVLDGDGDLIDGIGNVAAVGQTIRISAGHSRLPGGCVGGVPEYAFYKNGTLAQDFSARTFLLDAPEATVLASVPTAPLANHAYTVRARCSTDFSCTSVTGGSINVAVYTGDGSDSFFGTLASPPHPGSGVLYDPATGETTLNWWSPGSQAVDLYRGLLGGGRGTLVAPFYLLDDTGASCLLTDVAGAPASTGSNGTSGPLGQGVDPDPAPGEATYYLVSRNAPGGATVDALGCAAPGLCDDAPGTVCRADADCGGGLCLTHTGVALPPPFFGCPLPGEPHRLIRKIAAASLCP